MFTSIYFNERPWTFSKFEQLFSSVVYLPYDVSTGLHFIYHTCDSAAEEGAAFEVAVNNGSAESAYSKVLELLR